MIQLGLHQLTLRRLQLCLQRRDFRLQCSRLRRGEPLAAGELGLELGFIVVGGRLGPVAAAGRAASTLLGLLCWRRLVRRLLAASLLLIRRDLRLPHVERARLHGRLQHALQRRRAVREQRIVLPGLVHLLAELVELVEGLEDLLLEGRAHRLDRRLRLGELLRRHGEAACRLHLQNKKSLLDVGHVVLEAGVELGLHGVDDLLRILAACHRLATVLGGGAARLGGPPQLELGRVARPCNILVERVRLHRLELLDVAELGILEEGEELHEIVNDVLELVSLGVGKRPGPLDARVRQLPH